MHREQFFNLTQIIDGKNTMLPDIKGEIINKNDNSVVKISMELNEALRFSTIIFNLALFGFLAVIIFAQMETSNRIIGILVVSFLFISIWLLVYLGFNLFAKKSTQHLLEIFNVELLKEEENDYHPNS